MLPVGSVSRSSVLLFLRNLGSEVLVFVFTELVVRFITPSPSTRGERLKLLVLQCCLLSVAVLSLHLFHHRPLLLMLVVIAIFIRILLLFSQTGSGDAAPRDRHVSKPLRKSVTREPAVPMQWSPFGQGAAPGFSGAVGSVWPTRSSSLVHRHTSSNVSSQQFPQRSSVQPQVLAASRTSYPVKHTDITRPASRGQFGVINPNTLSRNTLKGSSTGDAAHSRSSHLQQEQGYLQYVSSFWGHSKPSRCPPGLYNSGNICFAVSTLQALAWTPGFVGHLKTVCQQRKKTPSPPSEKMQLLTSLLSLLNRCHVLPDGTTAFSPVRCSEFLKRVSNLVPYLVAPPLSSHRQTQQDASEFLLWLLDNLEGDGTSSESAATETQLEYAEEKKKECLLLLKDANSNDMATYREPLTQLAEADWLLESGKASFLTRELFLGQMVEARECQRCQKMSVNVEYFTLLPLPIPETNSGHTQLSLSDCLNHFGTVEELNNSNNMMVCPCSPAEGEGEEEVTFTRGKRLAMLSRLPKRLVIQLSRFSYNPERRSAQKNATPITLPLTLDLSPYLMEVKFNKKDPSKKIGRSDYRLYAVCIHTGAQSTSFGHYLAYCQASNGTWYFFNDSHVSVVESMEQELRDSVLLQNAYLLLYSTAEDEDVD